MILVRCACDGFTHRVPLHEAHPVLSTCPLCGLILSSLTLAYVLKSSVTADAD